MSALSRSVWYVIVAPSVAQESSTFVPASTSPGSTEALTLEQTVPSVATSPCVPVTTMLLMLVTPFVPTVLWFTLVFPCIVTRSVNAFPDSAAGSAVC